MRYNWSIRLQSSTSVIQRKTFRSVVFILLIIFLKSMLNPTIIVICLFIQIFSLFAYITYLNALMDMKYYKVNIFQLCKMFLNVVFTIIKFCIEFGLNPALTVICLFIYILFVCLFTYLISIISCSLKLEQITPPCQLCHAYYKVSNILYQILEDFLNVVFILIKFLIEFGLNPALAVVCLFIYKLFVCQFTYFISIISCSLKLEQITPPCQLCYAYYKVSNILYQIVEYVFK